MRWAGLLTAVGLLVTGCGLPQQGEVERVPTAELPAGPVGRPSRAVPAALVVVYLVEQGRLAPHVRTAPANDLRAALRALLEVGAPERAMRTAVPGGTELRDVRRDGEVLVLDLSRRFAEARGGEQVLAVAQVVWTVTEGEPAGRVRIAVDGQPLPVPVGDGEMRVSSVGRADYAAVAPRS